MVKPGGRVSHENVSRRRELQSSELRERDIFWSSRCFKPRISNRTVQAYIRSWVVLRLLNLPGGSRAR
ncbi:hypothetical protein NL676_037579 [Syzygium grande]|nr:hypothetical protein NL676_037579 [Syzygium grande]